MSYQIPAVAAQQAGSVQPPNNAPKEKPETAKKEVAGDQYVPYKQIKTGVYNAAGKVQQTVPEPKNLLDRFRAMQQSVEQQLLAFYDSFKDGAEASGFVADAHQELRTYFEENPQALEQVASGQVPEYWNVENTAKRMFDIATAGVEDKIDRQAFYEKAADFVNKSYDEVRLVIGFDFPPLVQETREALMNGLEQFRDGTDVDKIVFRQE